MNQLIATHAERNVQSPLQQLSQMGAVQGQMLRNKGMTEKLADVARGKKQDGMEFAANMATNLQSITDPLEQQKTYQAARFIAEKNGYDISEFPNEYNDEAKRLLSIAHAHVYNPHLLKKSMGKTPEQIDREIGVKEQANEIRRDELDLRREQGSKISLSSTVQKILDGAQTSAFKSGGEARELELLAKDFLSLDVGGGAPSTTSEKFKAVLGSQDAVSDQRRRFRAFRASRAVTNLPPGVASDKDIELALSGFPPENANNEAILSFLRGQAKLARLDEAYNLLKSDLISTQGDTRGLAKKWNEKLKDKDFQASLFSGIDGISSIGDTSTRATFNQPRNNVEQPPMQGARQAPDGNWYVERDGQFFKVEQ